MGRWFSCSLPVGCLIDKRLSFCYTEATNMIKGMDPLQGQGCVNLISEYILKSCAVCSVFVLNYDMFRRELSVDSRI